MDANFRLKSRDRNIKGDSALGPGWGYFTNHDHYKPVMDTFGPQEEVCILHTVPTFVINDHLYSPIRVTQAYMPLTMQTLVSLATIWPME